jgi:hypothetical protein
LKFAIIFISAGVFLVSCATSGALKSKSDAARPQPGWVADNEGVYPDSRWISVVETAKNQNTAQAAALNSLVQMFRVDVQAMTKTNQSFAQVATGAGAEKIADFTQIQGFAQDVRTASNVPGLIGVESDYWTAPNGTVYANARMNRKECAARYSALIRENEKVIAFLEQQAASVPSTFDAFELLNFAVNTADVTDSLQSILEVIDVTTAARKPSYGNAANVKTLAAAAARAIIITVRVSGDADGRVTKAFTSFLDKKGFRTNVSGPNMYLFVAEFELEPVELPLQRNKFVRYVLKASIEDRNGIEVFSHSENDRQGHVTEEEARQRALRAAEASIASGKFAGSFDSYLESLL